MQESICIPPDICIDAALMCASTIGAREGAFRVGCDLENDGSGFLQAILLRARVRFGGVVQLAEGYREKPSRKGMQFRLGLWALQTGFCYRLLN